MATQGRATSRKLTHLEKKSILERSLHGELPLDIAKALNVDTLRVSGYVRAMKNRGELPPSPGEGRLAEPQPPQPARPWRQFSQPLPPSPEILHLVRDNTHLSCQLEALQKELAQKNTCIQVLLDQLASKKRKS